MSNVKIELDHVGMNALLHDPGIQAELLRQGHAIQSRAGQNYTVKAVNMPSRSIVRVSAENAEGVRDNLGNNTLLKAVGK